MKERYMYIESGNTFCIRKKFLAEGMKDEIYILGICSGKKSEADDMDAVADHSGADHGDCQLENKCGGTGQDTERACREILRFHVLANSDSDADQQLKMQVKDALLAYMEAQMPETAGVEETGAWARTHTEDLERIGREVVAEKGYDYPVNAAVTTCYFPDKDYAGLPFRRETIQRSE